MIDNYGLWERHEAEQQRQLEKYPICDYCGEEILDDNLFDIDGNLYHEHCMEEQFRKPVENYMK